MGRRRYTVEDEKIEKWLIEEVVESAGLETDEPTKVTITDEQTGRTVSGAGSDYDEALEVACKKLGISPGDIDDEIDEDDEQADRVTTPPSRLVRLSGQGYSSELMKWLSRPGGSASLLSPRRFPAASSIGSFPAVVPELSGRSFREVPHDPPIPFPVLRPRCATRRGCAPSGYRAWPRASLRDQGVQGLRDTDRCAVPPSDLLQPPVQPSSNDSLGGDLCGLHRMQALRGKRVRVVKRDFPAMSREAKGFADAQRWFRCVAPILVLLTGCQSATTPPLQQGNAAMSGGSPTVGRTYDSQEDDPSTTNDESNDQPLGYFGTLTVLVTSEQSGNEYTVDADVSGTTLTRLYFPKGGWVDFPDCDLDEGLCGECEDEEGRSWTIQGATTGARSDVLDEEEGDQEEEGSSEDPDDSEEPWRAPSP